VAQLSTRINQVANSSLQFLDLRESAIASAGPDDFPIYANFKNAARLRHERHLSENIGESAQELLRNPSGAQ